MSECVGFNVSLDMQWVISETRRSLSGQSIALVLTTNNNDKTPCVHHKYKRETEKLPQLTKQSIYTQIWYVFLQSQARKRGVYMR